jgi:hypothetical protein
MTILISTQISQSTIALFSLSSIIEINTSFSDSVSIISLVLNSLKRHLELRYRLDFSHSLTLLVMRCIQNATNSQQVLKFRLFKKIMNDFNRDKWLKIMKKKNKSFLINEIWILTNSSKDRQMLRDKWIYKFKRKRHDEILRYKTR